MISRTEALKVVIKMFDFFRKKRISKYVLGVRNYISSNFKAVVPVQGRFYKINDRNQLNSQTTKSPVSHFAKLGSL